MIDILQSDIGDLGDGRDIIPFFTNEWSLHDLIAFVLQFTGKADILLSTFSISESAVRSFINLRDENLLGKLDIIIDHTARKNKVDVMLFANENFKLYLNDVHAKIVQIIGKNHMMIIVATSNLNTVKRYEAGMIIVDMYRTKLYFENKLQELLNQSTPYTPDGIE